MRQNFIRLEPGLLELAGHLSIASNAAAGSVVRVDVTDYAAKCAGRPNATLVIVRQLRNPQITGNAGAQRQRALQLCLRSMHLQP